MTANRNIYYIYKYCGFHYSYWKLWRIELNNARMTTMFCCWKKVSSLSKTPNSDVTVCYRTSVYHCSSIRNEVTVHQQALCTELWLPMCDLSVASVHKGESPGSGCKEPEAPAAVWGRASAVMPPCGRLCYYRQTNVINVLTWSENCTGKTNSDCTCQRTASPLHRKPAAAPSPDWPLLVDETSPLHVGLAPG